MRNTRDKIHATMYAMVTLNSAHSTKGYESASKPGERPEPRLEATRQGTKTLVAILLSARVVGLEMRPDSGGKKKRCVCE